MPPTVAALITVACIAFLLVRDGTRADQRQPALWLPVLWLLVTGSRFVSQWLSLGQPQQAGPAEGSMVDALYFLSLIVAGLWVLRRRGVQLAEVVRHNPWLLALLAWGLLSIAWSDFPWIAFKRWIKVLGHPVMALIIVTEPDVRQALGTVLKRCAFVLLPASALFIKYYPAYGRTYDSWTGQPHNTGVAMNKNDLGYVCMVLGIFFTWNLLTARRLADAAARRSEMGLSIVFLGLLGWLLAKADSATGLAGLAVGVATLIGLGWHLISRRYVGSFLLLAALVAYTLESYFGWYGELLKALGRNATLTDRTIVWADALALHDRPLTGQGFESFWLGDRLDAMWAKWAWQPIQAHNGYLETYLNLGIVGVVLLAGFIVSTFRRISRELRTDFDFARLKLALLFAILLFNYTEAGFGGVHFVWTIFLVIAMQYPKPQPLGHAPAVPPWARHRVTG
jgi:exopolysaccharide production protein ExoQ